MDDNEEETNWTGVLEGMETEIKGNCLWILSPNVRNEGKLIQERSTNEADAIFRAGRNTLKSNRKWSGGDC